MCVTSKQCGLCSDDILLTNVTIDFNTEYYYVINWDSQLNVSSYKVERLNFSSQIFEEYESTILSDGEIGYGERGIFLNSYPYFSNYTILDDSIPSNKNSFNDTSVEPGGKYRYKVSAQFNISDGLVWVPIFEKVIVLEHFAEIRWSAFPRATSYKILRGKDIQSLYTFAEISADKTEYTDNSMALSQFYTYQIIARAPRCCSCSQVNKCDLGPTNINCTNWSYLRSMPNPTEIGKISQISNDLQDSQTHFFEVVPPVAGLALHVIIESDSNLYIFASKNDVPSLLTASRFSSRQSSPFVIHIEPNEMTCDGKLIPGEWFEGNVYEPLGCDKWIVAIKNKAYNVDYYTDPYGRGNRNLFGSSVATYSISIFYDFNFEDFSCPAADGDCGLYGLSISHSSSYQQTYFDGTIFDSSNSISSSISNTSNVIRLTSNSKIPQIGTAYYRTKLSLNQGFETSFTFRITNPSTCRAPREVLDFTRTEDIRQTNFLKDSISDTLPPITSGLNALNSEFDIDNGIAYNSLPVSGVNLPIRSLDLESSECFDDGYGKIGGEGFAFVIHNDPNGINSVGCSGEGIGFAENEILNCKNKILNSLAIEFDTHFGVKQVTQKFSNLLTPNKTHSLIEYTSQNQISVHLNGQNDHNSAISITSLSQSNQTIMFDGLIHKARIVLIPPTDNQVSTFYSLEVWIDDRKIIKVPVDVTNFLDTFGKGYLGFTSSTGLASENHDILSWSYCSKVDCGSV
eukprot:c20889_g1_i3.p1 GENE.c20889_g1_i3~~c20889_g1_i3.p1  ORF type:complete len:741 (-),score=208.18 c20889_g1_i3:32-2254(-)